MRLPSIVLASTLFLQLSFFAVHSQSLPSADSSFVKEAKQCLKEAAAQYHQLAEMLPADRFPRTWQKDTLVTSSSGWWCSGFYSGTLLQLSAALSDTSLYLEAMRNMLLLRKEQYNSGTHDLGFMMYNSFGTALHYFPDSSYLPVLLNSARSLSTRFSPVTGCIKSWDSKPEDFLVIIDNMMNLELLLWATQASADSNFYRIAVQHANSTLQHHFRPDYSSWHVLNYNPQTGAVQQKRTAQGAADSSAWARGQSWGLYGYTVMYRFTKDEQYLRQADSIAAFLLNHPHYPADGIPYWDYDAPGIPDAPRDASAAAIMASALLELSQYTDAATARRYLQQAVHILRTLSSDIYRAAPGTNGGFLLKHSIGSLPQHSEIDVPLTYADYYYVEALLRYLALNGQ